MNDREYKEIQYQAFFDELMGIQKEAGVANAGLLKSIQSGAKMMWNNPNVAKSTLTGAWKGGEAAARKAGAGDIGQIWGGIKGVGKTGVGRAIGATGLGIGTIGAGSYGLGRMQG